MKILMTSRVSFWLAIVGVSAPLCSPLLAKITGYPGAPSHYDALVAVQSEIEGRSAGNYFAGHGGPVSGRANFPIDIQLLRCDENPNRLLPAANGYSQNISGYECIVDVFPAAEPAYRVGGFFYFDGLSWRYYGPLRAPEIIAIDKFEQSQEPGVLQPKPGAIFYRGFTGPDQDDKYHSILGRGAD